MKLLGPLLFGTYESHTGEIHTVASKGAPKCLDGDLNLDPFDPNTIELQLGTIYGLS
jgi:hypothetical protein